MTAIFNYKTPASNLYGRFVSAESRYFDFGECDIPGWNSLEATECEQCGSLVVMGGEQEAEHSEVDRDSDCRGYIYTSGPMMNYIWPIDTGRVHGAENAVLAVVHLPLCIVKIDDGEFFALTGGGMDLSWEIIEGYMRLGYLPPLSLIAPPAMAGKTLTAKNKWLLAGCSRSVTVEGWRVKGKRADIKHLRSMMRNEKDRLKENK